MNIVGPVKTLDCKDYKCPLPQVQAKEALERMEELEIIEILTTDEDAEKEFKRWTSETGDIYLAFEKKEDHAIHYIQKAPYARRKEGKKFEKIMLNHELFEKLRNHEPLTLVDVREEIEYMIGHIPEAIHIPLGEIKDNLKQFDKAQTYAIICRTGNRSDFACQLLADAGFRNIYNVLPGMSEWDGEVE